MDELTKDNIADFICGDKDQKYPVYRSSSYITRFFANLGRPDLVHDGSTRWYWVRGALDMLSDDEFTRAILQLVDIRTYEGDREKTAMALAAMNEILAVDGLKVKYEGSKPVIVEHQCDLFFDPESEETVQTNEMKLPDEFLQAFGEPDSKIIGSRCEEAAICAKNGAYTMAVIAMGSALEAMILFVLERYPADANRCSAAPRGADGRTKRFSAWKLADMIAVSHELGWIDRDVRDFAIVLRDFRNYIHPNVERMHGGSFDADTCMICWQVLIATANDLGALVAGRGNVN